MSFSKRFIQLRKERDLTQQQMADTVGIHITQVKRYEAGQAQPSVELLKKIATAFNVTTDWLIFDEGERELPNELQLKFEAVSQMSENDQQVIQPMIDGMILKHTASQLGAAGRNQSFNQPVGDFMQSICDFFGAIGSATISHFLPITTLAISVLIMWPMLAGVLGTYEDAGNIQSRVSLIRL